MNINHAIKSFLQFTIMDHLVKYYIRQDGGGNDDVGPIYVLPSQRGHVIGSFLSGLFRAVRPVFWSGAKDFGTATL